MALTLAEAQRRSNNVLEKGIIDVLLKVGDILPMIPFEDFSGTSYDYLRSATRSTVSVRAVGDAWTEDAPVSTSVSAKLKIIGGDVDTDHFLEQTLSNINDQKALSLQDKLTAMAETCNDLIVYGDEVADVKQWDGLHSFLKNNTGQRVELTTNATPVALSIAKLRQMLRLVKPQKPDVLIMSRKMRDAISKYYESLGSALTPIDLFGQAVASFDSIPILATDYVTDTETYDATGHFSSKTGGSGTSIFAVRFGVDALMGISKGGIQVIEFPNLETKDAHRYRVRWYLNPVVIKSTLAVAGITGADPAAAVTA